MKRNRGVLLLLLVLAVAGSVAVSNSAELDEYSVCLPLVRRDPTYPRWGLAEVGPDGYPISDVATTGDGGFVLVGGSVWTSSPYPGWVLKLNREGVTQWQKTHQIGTGLSHVDGTSDGGLVAAGASSSYEIIAVVKHAADGSVVWRKNFDIADDGTAVGDVKVVSDGVLIAGYRLYYHGWVWKLNHDGSIAWQRGYGTNHTYGFGSIRATSDGGYVVAGSTQINGAGNMDGWILKLNADGTVAWQKTYGTTEGTEYLTAVSPVGDDGFVATGHKGFGFTDGWVLRLNIDGSVRWSKSIDRADEDKFYSVGVAEGGGHVVVGYSWTQSSPSTFAWAVKLTDDGAITWQRVYGAGSLKANEAVNEGGYLAGGTWGGETGVLRLDGTGRVPDCDAIQDSTGTLADFLVTVGDYPGSSVMYSITNYDSVQYVGGGTAVMAQICPAGSATTQFGTR